MGTDTEMTMGQYIAWCQEMASIPGNIRRWDRPYYAQMPVEPGSRCLDVGAYCAANLIRLAIQGCSAVGVEIAEPYYRAAQANIEGSSESVRALVTLHRMAFEEFEDAEPFDAVFCTEILKFVLNPQGVVSKCFGHLRPGGVAYFAETRTRGRTHRRDAPEGAILEWCQQAGFDVSVIPDASYLIFRAQRPEVSGDTYKEINFPHLLDRNLFRRVYDDLYSNPTYAEKPPPALVWLTHFNPRPQSDILDLGAGMGGHMLYLARLGHRVDGVEVSGRAVELFWKFHRQSPPDVQKRMSMVCAFVEDYKPLKKYDYVLVTEVLEHVVDPVAILAKAAEAVKSNGEVYVTVPCWGRLNFSHVRWVTQAKLGLWAERAGLDIFWTLRDERHIYCKMARAQHEH